MILDYIQDQDTSVGRLASDAPAFEKIDSVAIDVCAVEGIDGHYCDLSMSLLIDLEAGALHLSDGLRLENMRKIINVTDWVQLRDWFGMHGHGQQHEYQWHNAVFREQFHRCPIVQDYIGRVPTDCMKSHDLQEFCTSIKVRASK
jgi:hypothetical protein